MARVLLDDISVVFPVYTTHARSLRTAVYSGLGGQLAAHDRMLTVRALHAISLDLTDGDRLGLVGPNGAGKTSLLRVISRVYHPAAGLARIDGSVSSFTDIALGMDREATGWQNIVLRCVFLGLTFSQARALSPSIAEFSELGAFLDLPVRTYSTGMFVRLAFSISTAVRPDIVVMDEMIGAGDQNFIGKARQRVGELLDHSRILVIASHTDDIIRTFCNKVLWLEGGKARMLGPVDDVLRAYAQAPRPMAQS